MVLPFNVALYSGVSVAALFSAAGAADAYAVGGNAPEFVADFAGVLNSGTEYYRSGGSTVAFGDIFTFTRPSTATYVNSSGVLTTASSGVARRNHHVWNGSSWENAGILIEPAAATNLFLNSSNFTVTWTTFQASISQTGTGPDGVTNSAAILTDDGGGGTGSALIQIANPNYEVAANSTQVQSIYAKANGSNFLCMEFDGLTAPVTDTRAWFNLSTGSVGTTTADVQAATIENVGGGWYRCAVRFTTGADNFGAIVLRICDADNSTSCARDGASSIIVYGCQLEVGSTATSYIPTSGSTVTRAAETLTAAGSSLPANTTGVSVQMQGRMTYADLGTEAQRTFWRWYNGASDFLLCDLDTDGADTGEVNANQSDTTGGAGTVAIDAYSPGINVAYNIASRHSNTDINLAVDGTAGTADATPTALHDASGDTFQVAHNLQGTVGMLRVWGVGLSDTDLESAT